MKLDLHNAHAGETAIITACGPSLNDIPLSMLRKHQTIGVNRSYLYHVPNYYVAVEPGMLQQYCQEIAALPSEKWVWTPYAPRCGAWPMGSSQEVRFHETPDPVYQGYTVTYCAMQLAYWLGFRVVLLAGLDHRWGDGKDHFANDYFTGEYVPPRLDKVNEAYRLAREYYRANGRVIYNITEGSACDIFERRDWRDYA